MLCLYDLRACHVRGMKMKDINEIRYGCKKEMRTHEHTHVGKP